MCHQSGVGGGGVGSPPSVVVGVIQYSGPIDFFPRPDVFFSLLFTRSPALAFIPPSKIKRSRYSLKERALAGTFLMFLFLLSLLTVDLPEGVGYEAGKGAGREEEE